MFNRLVPLLTVARVMTEIEIGRGSIEKLGRFRARHRPARPSARAERSIRIYFAIVPQPASRSRVINAHKNPSSGGKLGFYKAALAQINIAKS